MYGFTEMLFRRIDSDCNGPEAKRLQLSEWLLALAITVMALYMHGFNYVKAGGLWRDEVNSVTLAMLPDLSGFWSALQYDSFPVMHYLAIRGWSSMFGSGDVSLRLLGLTVGVFLIGALWLNAVGFRGRAPLVSLLLIGLNPMMIRSLDALRPNGLAALATVLAFTTVWRAIQQSSATRLAVATLSLLFCVQILFQAAIFILAIGIAAIVTGFFKGGVRRALLLAVPFVITAFSLVPYVGHLQKAAKWFPVAASMADDKVLITGLLKVVNTPSPLIGWIWLALGGVATAGLVRSVCWGAARHDNYWAGLEVTIYCGVTLVTATVVFMLFLAKGVGFSPQPWHYVPLLVLLVVAVEPLIAHCLKSIRWRLLLLLLIAGSAVASLNPAAQQLKSKMTSIDLIAAAIAGEASPNDLVVLVPWFNGVSFSRYYHGRAPWLTFPLLGESSLHRYDLLKEKMSAPESIKAELEVILTTLRHGGKVWVVGDAFPLVPGTQVSLLPPPPLPQSGWSSFPYLTNWSRYLLAALATHSCNGELLSVNGTSNISSQESPSIMVFSGFR